MARKSKSKCLVDVCTRESEVRGLCRRCYMMARRMMSEGKITEHQLIRRGLIAKRNATNIFRQAVEAKGGGK